jgi:hypothetical protein
MDYNNFESLSPGWIIDMWRSMLLDVLNLTRVSCIILETALAKRQDSTSTMVLGSGEGHQGSQLLAPKQICLMFFWPGALVDPPASMDRL